MKPRLLHIWAVLILNLLASHCTAPAATYNRQTYLGDGAAGVVGSGSLSLSNSASTVYAGFNRGAGSFIDNLVMFIDSVPGGYTSTGVFSDNANAQQIAISGNGLSRSTANFAPGFAADYAVVVSVNYGSGVYKMVDDGTGPHLQLVHNFNLAPPGDPNSTQFYWQFAWADIGLANANTNFFKFETSLITATGSRYLQSFEGLTGTAGWNTITFTNYDTFGVQPVPENTSMALAVFGGIVAVVVVTSRLRRSRVI
ncbi:MAG TPA: hypothetical protein VL793_05460 [Patescibacteria group bacterium]|nr:hypothetical protein [Patescibacteria group bacterium]